MARDSRPGDSDRSESVLDQANGGNLENDSARADRPPRHHVHYIQLSDIMFALRERRYQAEGLEVCHCRFCLTQSMIKTT